MRALLRPLAKLVWFAASLVLGYLIWWTAVYETDPGFRWGALVLYTMMFFGVSIVCYPLSRAGFSWSDWDAVEEGREIVDEEDFIVTEDPGGDDDDDDDGDGDEPPEIDIQLRR